MSALQGKRGLMEGLSSRGRVGARRTLHVSRALTKERKHEVVTKLKSELETSTAVVGFSFKGVSVSDMEKLRGDIPDDAALVVAKNTLMKKAAEEVDGWSEVGQFCTGSNAFLFLREDLKTGFKGLRDLEKTYEKADYPVELNGGCCDGDFLSLDDIKKLEKLPSKLELIAKIASMVNQVPTRLAVGVKQVPTKLATGIKKVSEGNVEPAEQAAAQS
ncbi:plastid ribosomal protein L10 [Chloropicon primus]|uniref:Plastid ribosomal protein L10 n=1 Tax=Chloropicon primus TaxID=1764295 RepID=A0A5B8MIS3_9CHLO|nr:plastid ribosomal protein L10 [Chloropicon primus]UPQ99605.1 plastid ribosomal protein L10 [Chloropicon primus]|eukprot:QDZ20396.1 plastid ribosomal protein L10 [Chloropicon primus]